MAKNLVADEVALTSTDRVEGIQDDVYFQIKNEFDQVRSSLGMYISSGGNIGALHLLKELTNNCLDETNNENPHWKNHNKEVVIEFYESERRFVVSDNGRGIPTDILVSAVMHKHTSTKTIGISQSRNKKQAGMNGVGLTVTAALTDYMSVTTYRGKYAKTIELFDGELKEYPVANLKSAKTGTTVTIIPSETYLGPLSITTDMVEDYVRNMSYIIEPDVTLTFMGEKDPKAKNKKYFSRTYKAQGLGAAVRYLSSSLEFPPVEVKFTSNDFDISLAFSYDRSLDEMSIASFCNYVVTTEGGCHEAAATRAICDYFTKESKRQDPSSKLEVAFDDCRKGLVMAVNLEHVAPKFEGQHKTKVSNNEIVTDAKRGLYGAIYKVMNNNPALLKKIISYLRQVSKARQESHKIKGVSVKKKTTFLEDAEIEKYFPVSNRNSTGYKELFLCEGDSAAGSILNCRNPRYQAVYTVNGVTDNVHDLSLTQLLKKKTFMDLITILGTGIGKDFDITKLRYDKVIICTDSDVDGYNITSLLLCFFYIFMPELIRAGKIFKAMPPLYLMDLKSLRKYYNGREWLYDKSEYYHMINTIIVDNCEICLEASPTSNRGKSKSPEVIPLSRKDAMEWLNMNSEYKLELDNLGKKSACSIDILETVCFLRKRCKDQQEFHREIAKAFPEMKYEPKTYSLMGSYNGEFFSLICDGLFDKIAERFMGEVARNQYLYVWYRNKKDSHDKLKRATIGEFLDEMGRVFNVKIDQRYKGLGEADADLLFRTTTNPKYRRLIRVQIRDIERTNEIFELMHGSSEKIREARRQLVDNTKMSYADIDN